MIAVMRNGTERQIASRYGSTVEELVAYLTRDSLTGSAVALADAEIEMSDGSKVRYADVNTFEATSSRR